ncbi:MAG: D-alanine--D-alanine ligase, partial [Myxococcales bacterium]
MTYERVAVLMGGWGEEREISVRTGEAVARALQKQRAPRQVHRVLAGPGLDRALRGLDVQAVFVALHGRMGEDGSVQGLLEVLELPYTGSGVLASALAMDKPMAKKVLAHHNLPTPRGYVTAAAPAEEVLERHGDFGFPVVVKPARSGSSCGLSVVADAGALPAAVASAARFGGAVLVERLVRGRELTVAVLDDEVLGSCEIQPSAGVFDHASKYGGRSRYRLRPRVSPTRLRNVEALALTAHRAL